MNESQLNEPLEVSGTEEPLPGLMAGLSPVSSPGLIAGLSSASTELQAEETPAPVAPGPLWLRLAYALEFLIALIAIISLWSEIGGEGHLELMPWYIKLACIVGLAWCCVRFTASIVEQQKVWTRRTIGWFTGILLFCVAMGGITYYYHLHEEPDEGDEDSTAGAVSISSPGTLFYDASKATGR